MTRRSPSTGKFVKSGTKRRKRKKACKKTPCRTASGAFGREVCYPTKARKGRRRRKSTSRARTRSGRFK